MIEVKNVSYKYSKDQEAISNLSLNIKKGKWVSILGHNGSGKSTLAKLLLGLLEADSGEIKIDGLVLSQDNLKEIRKKIGIVFQNPDNQFVGVTVRYDIAFGLENQKLKSCEIEEKVFKYAKIVGMEKYLEKQPHMLSGGQKQKVAIAGALAMNQEILILDEATSMLDPKGTSEIVELIKLINQEYEKTIITITHDLSLAKLSDYLFILKDGSLLLEGSPDDVFKKEEELKLSNLEIPTELSVYNEILKAKKNSLKLTEALWELNSKM